MALLLEQRGDEVKIIERVARATTNSSGEKVMVLLLETRGNDVEITRNTAKAALDAKYLRQSAAFSMV